MDVKFMEHLSDDRLEAYSMETLPEDQVAALEEHLLVCGDCQNRLRATDEHVAAMRSAAPSCLAARGFPGRNNQRELPIPDRVHGNRSASGLLFRYR